MFETRIRAVKIRNGILSFWDGVELKRPPQRASYHFTDGAGEIDDIPIVFEQQALDFNDFIYPSISVHTPIGKYAVEALVTKGAEDPSPGGWIEGVVLKVNVVFPVWAVVAPVERDVPSTGHLIAVLVNFLAGKAH